MCPHHSAMPLNMIYTRNGFHGKSVTGAEQSSCVSWAHPRWSLLLSDSCPISHLQHALVNCVETAGRKWSNHCVLLPSKSSSRAKLSLEQQTVIYGVLCTFVPDRHAHWNDLILKDTPSDFLLKSLCFSNVSGLWTLLGMCCYDCYLGCLFWNARQSSWIGWDIVCMCVAGHTYANV